MEKLPKYFKIKHNKGNPLWVEFNNWAEANKHVSKCNSFKGYFDIIMNYKHEDVGNLPKCLEITLEEWSNCNKI